MLKNVLVETSGRCVIAKLGKFCFRPQILLMTFLAFVLVGVRSVSGCSKKIYVMSQRCQVKHRGEQCMAAIKGTKDSLG